MNDQPKQLYPMNVFFKDGDGWKVAQLRPVPDDVAEFFAKLDPIAINPICGEVMDDYHCNREPNHSGFHASFGFHSHVAAVWMSNGATFDALNVLFGIAKPEPPASFFKCDIVDVAGSVMTGCYVNDVGAVGIGGTCDDPACGFWFSWRDIKSMTNVTAPPYVHHERPDRFPVIRGDGRTAWVSVPDDHV